MSVDLTGVFSSLNYKFNDNPFLKRYTRYIARERIVMRVIFLDIDGVLNSYETIDRNFDYPELDPRNL